MSWMSEIVQRAKQMETEKAAAKQREPKEDKFSKEMPAYGVPQSNGLPTTKADGTLTDYGKSLQVQSEAKSIADLYQRAQGFDSSKGMYGGLTPTYEAYVGANVPLGNAVVSREQWAQAQQGNVTRERDNDRSLSSILPNLGGVTTPTVVVKPAVPTVNVPNNAINVSNGTTPAYSTPGDISLSEFNRTVSDTQMTPATWKRFIAAYPGMKTLYSGLRS